jgi:hypothetical protein
MLASRGVAARKQFFFEKKNQKTFIRLSVRTKGSMVMSQTDKSFLVLFFKKELLASFRATP